MDIPSIDRLPTSIKRDQFPLAGQTLRIRDGDNWEAMPLIYYFFAFVGFYLIVGIPIFFFVSVCTLVFALLVSEARREMRRSMGFLFLLSLVHLGLSFVVFGGDNTRPNAFDFFLQIAACATPVVFLITLLLTVTSHTDDSHS